MGDKRRRVCPVEMAGSLDNRMRRWVQNPGKIFHVSKKAFQETVGNAEKVGFKAVDEPKVFFSRSVVLREG